jgi:Flp pilus assembly protein CpaB
MNRRIVLVAIAVVLALVGTIAVYTYAHHADQRAIAKTRSTSVLYATKQIPPGTTWRDAVSGGYLTSEKVPVDSAPTHAIPSTAASIPSSYVTTAGIPAGQIAVTEMFGETQVTTGILNIPKGYQAMSISVPVASDVAGFVQSGSEVAIYATSKIASSNPPASVVGGDSSGSKPDVYVTKLLLAKVTVIAASQGAPAKLDGANGSQNNNNTSNTNVLVTLSLTQNEAERVILAQQVGTLYLSLLTPDSGTAADNGIWNAIISKLPSPLFTLGQ